MIEIIADFGEAVELSVRPLVKERIQCPQIGIVCLPEQPAKVRDHIFNVA
jgi:hypothetical protein